MIICACCRIISLAEILENSAADSKTAQAKENSKNVQPLQLLKKCKSKSKFGSLVVYIVYTRIVFMSSYWPIVDHSIQMKRTRK